MTGTPVVGTVQVDGRPVRLTRIDGPGGAPTLVWWHSELGEVGDQPFLRALAGHGIGVLAPEIPGFGATEAPEAGLERADLWFMCRRILDELAPGPVALGGAGLGGWLAAELAVWWPRRVTALVVADAFGLHLDDAPVHDIFGAPHHETWDRMFPGGGDALAHIRPALADPGDPDAVLVHLFRAQAATARVGWNPFLHDPLLADRLGTLRVPALVVWGGSDGVVPPAHAHRWAALLPDARLEVLDGAGHLPHLERPDEVAALIAGHLRGSGS